MSTPIGHTEGATVIIVDRVTELVRTRNPTGLIQQGTHLDPRDPGTPPPDHSDWPASHLAALEGPELELFHRNLSWGTADVRSTILEELATYHEIDVEEALQRCRDWEALSVAEWQAADRLDAAGLLQFYRTMQSWSFDLLWYAYLQSEGYHVPVSVVALRWLQHHGGPGRRHLDFGSGVGATAQLFHEAGWASTLGDVSSTLLDFARFRLERRGQQVRYLDLAQQQLPVGGFDVITAIDALAHVPDIRATARDLHAALAPGGLLLANIDARPPSPENAWHLHDDERTARYHLQRAGFRQIGRDSLRIYQKVDPATNSHVVRSDLNWIRLANPALRSAKSLLQRLGRD